MAGKFTSRLSLTILENCNFTALFICAGILTATLMVEDTILLALETFTMRRQAKEVATITRTAAAIGLKREETRKANRM
jgi:hypothetical protein